MTDIVIPLDSKIGIKRDNTDYNSEYYIDGTWCRFYDNSPKKMGGYKLIYGGTSEIIRTLYEFNNSNTVNVYLGREIGGISFLNINSNGSLVGAEINRTPSGYVSVVGNVWTFDQINYLDSNHIPYSVIFAQVAPNDINTNSNIEGNVYYGGAYDTGLFQPVMNNAGTPVPITASGGIIVATPLVIAYGNYGVIQWSEPGEPLLWKTISTATIANTPKIIAAATIRDNIYISVLFWCVDKLVRATYDAALTIPTFSSVVLDDTISILSKDSVCEYNNIYYWVGNTQFYSYDGVVKKLPNNLSTDYFFNNLNRAYQGRIHTTVVKKYSEIWIHYPSGNSTECNETIIHNTEYNTFYDASMSRTCSVPASAVLPYPLLAAATSLLNPTIPPIMGVFTRTYGIWMHEYGVDQIAFNNVYAIESRIVTKYFSFLKDNPNNNNCTILKRIENDFVQVGNIKFRILKKAWPNTPAFYSDYYTITPTTEKVDINNEDRMSRIWAIEFVSNEVGGDFILGKTQAVLSIGDKRPQPTEITD
jgi:hypothetical protein